MGIAAALASFAWFAAQAGRADASLDREGFIPLIQEDFSAPALDPSWGRLPGVGRYEVKDGRLVYRGGQPIGAQGRRYSKAYPTGTLSFLDPFGRPYRPSLAVYRHFASRRFDFEVKLTIDYSNEANGRSLILSLDAGRDVGRSVPVVQLVRHADFAPQSHFLKILAPGKESGDLLEGLSRGIQDFWLRIERRDELLAVSWRAAAGAAYNPFFEGPVKGLGDDHLIVLRSNVFHEGSRFLLDEVRVEGVRSGPPAPPPAPLLPELENATVKADRILKVSGEAGYVWLRNCEVKGELRFQGHVRARIVLDDCTLDTFEAMHGSQFHDFVDLERSKIGYLRCDDVKFMQGVNFSYTTTPRRASFRDAVFHGPLSLAGVRWHSADFTGDKTPRERQFHESVSLSDAHFFGPGATFYQAIFAKDLLLAHTLEGEECLPEERPHLGESLDLTYTKILGLLALSAGSPPDPGTLRITRTYDGPVQWALKTNVFLGGSEVRKTFLSRVRFDGDFSFYNARFGRGPGDGLYVFETRFQRLPVGSWPWEVMHASPDVWDHLSTMAGDAKDETTSRMARFQGRLDVARREGEGFQVALLGAFRATMLFGTSLLRFLVTGAFLLLTGCLLMLGPCWSYYVIRRIPPEVKFHLGTFPIVPAGDQTVEYVIVHGWVHRVLFAVYLSSWCLFRVGFARVMLSGEAPRPVKGIVVFVWLVGYLWYAGVFYMAVAYGFTGLL